MQFIQTARSFSIFIHASAVLAWYPYKIDMPHFSISLSNKPFHWHPKLLTTYRGCWCPCGRPDENSGGIIRGRFPVHQYGVGGSSRAIDGKFFFLKHENVLIDRGVSVNCGMGKNKWLRVKYVSLHDIAFQSKRTAKANPHMTNVVRIKLGR